MIAENFVQNLCVSLKIWKFCRGVLLLPHTVPIWQSISNAGHFRLLQQMLQWRGLSISVCQAHVRAVDRMGCYVASSASYVQQGLR